MLRKQPKFAEEQPRIRGEKPHHGCPLREGRGTTPHTRGKLHNQQVYRTTIEFSFNVVSTLHQLSSSLQPKLGAVPQRATA